MFYLIKDGKITGSSEQYLKQEGFETIEKNFNISELEKIMKGCLYIDGDFIESEESIKNKKEELVLQYKEIQKNIVDIKSELKEIEDTFDTYNEQGKKISNLRKINLEEKIKTFRDKKDNLVLEGITLYGESLLNEL